MTIGAVAGLAAYKTGKFLDWTFCQVCFRMLWSLMVWLVTMCANQVIGRPVLNILVRVQSYEDFFCVQSLPPQVTPFAAEYSGVIIHSGSTDFLPA